MRIAICYPPIPSPKGTPLLSQNRQFQWFHRPTAIYPVVPASAATLLRAHGHDVLWLDGIARGLTPEACWRELEAWGPDAVFLETKTPVVKFHWAWVRELKRRLPRCQALIAGDHVTAFPEETRRNAPVDAVLTGGDYDFALLSWAEGRDVPVDLAALPQIDRALTRWRDYATRNGNFLRTPGAYLMSARDCWYARSDCSTSAPAKSWTTPAASPSATGSAPSARASSRAATPGACAWTATNVSARSASKTSASCAAPATAWSSSASNPPTRPPSTA